jgi:amino acid transporter
MLAAPLNAIVPVGLAVPDLVRRPSGWRFGFRWRTSGVHPTYAGSIPSVAGLHAADLSYALIAREIPSAGSAYTWLSEAIHPFAGFWIGILLLQTYLFCVILQPIVFGVFFNDLVASVFHLKIGFGTTMLGIIVPSLIVACLTYPGIQISARASLRLAVVEVLVVLALFCTILVVLIAHGRLEWTDVLQKSCQEEHCYA